MLIFNIKGKNFFVSHKVKFLSKEGKEIEAINNQSLLYKKLYDLKDEDIIGISWDITNEIFKDDDEWFWFRTSENMTDKIFRCDEFFGLKKFLSDKKYLKNKI